MSDARPSLAPGLCYRDPRAALAWLERAFGFETTMVIENPDGTIGHSQMRVGEDGLLMVGREWDDLHKSPASIGGLNTQVLHVNLPAGEDIDAHYRRAIAAGAVSMRPPEDQFYGERTYGVADLEGHGWTFSIPLRTLSNAELAEAGGVEVHDKLVSKA